MALSLEHNFTPSEAHLARAAEQGLGQRNVAELTRSQHLVRCTWDAILCHHYFPLFTDFYGVSFYRSLPHSEGGHAGPSAEITACSDPIRLTNIDQKPPDAGQCCGPCNTVAAKTDTISALWGHMIRLGRLHLPGDWESQ